MSGVTADRRIKKFVADVYKFTKKNKFDAISKNLGKCVATRDSYIISERLALKLKP